MARDLTAEFIAELKAKSKSIAYFFTGEFATGTVYLWSGLGNIDWNSQTWVGIGNVVQISQIKETGSTRADGVNITLSGISEETRALALAEARQGKPGTVFIGFIADNGSVVEDPAAAFEGRLDVPTINDGGSDISIIFSYENRLIDLERAREERYTNESQLFNFPTDIGFQYVPSVQDWNGVWGRI